MIYPCPYMFIRGLMFPFLTVMIKSNCMARRRFQYSFFVKIFFLLIFIGSPIFVSAQNPVAWSLESDAKGKTLKEGEVFKARLKAQIEGDWHLYALEQPAGGPIATTIKIPEDKFFKINGKPDSPAPVTKFDPNFNIDTKFYEKQAEFNLPVQATRETKADELAVNVRFQLCNDTLCLPPKTVKVTFGGFEDVKKQSTVNSQQSAIEDKNSFANNEQQTTNSVNSANSLNSPNSTLWSFLWLAVSLGALSLLTPCVFPMIPITVSYFTNHSAGNRGKAVKMASVYSLGIVATFTLLGMLLAIFVGAAGINIFAANPYVNLLIAGIFLFFAFNLFGAY